MSMDRIIGSLTLISLLVLAACGSTLSDTGYTGTWNRPGSGLMTTISIVAQGDGYLFRWGRESEDGRVHVRCDWEGACTETVDGEIRATYQMRSWVDEESGRLRVECHGLRNKGAEDENSIHYVDELVVRRDGMRLVSKLIVSDGVELEGKGHGKRIFEKFSNSVVDPPAKSNGRD